MRPTGGGIVRHGEDLIYSVIARRSSNPAFEKIRISYLAFHEIIQTAFQAIGIETRLFRCDEPAFRNRSRLGDPSSECFRHPIPTDVGIGNQKLAGGAQWRRGEAFLHQGSVRLPRGISFDRLKEALIRAFKEKFQIQWEKSPAGFAPVPS